MALRLDIELKGLQEIYKESKDRRDVIVNTYDIKSEDETTQILINNMICLLKELEGNYPENIEVK